MLPVFIFPPVIRPKVHARLFHAGKITRSKTSSRSWPILPAAISSSPMPRTPTWPSDFASPGRSPEHYAGEARFRTLDEFRQIIREIVAQGLVDIMLMSASTNEMLTIDERLFDGSHVTPGGPRQRHHRHLARRRRRRYGGQPSLPFRTATIDHIQCGKRRVRAGRASHGRRPGAVFRHVQQRHRARPPGRWKHTRRSAWRPKPRAFGTFWKCSIRTPAAITRRPTWADSLATRSCGRWRA